MLLAIIAGAVCFAAATIMYTPRMRSYPFYRPISLIFLFEGIWILLDYIFRQIYPDNVIMQIINYIGTILLVIYFVISIFVSSGKKHRDKRKGK